MRTPTDIAAQNVCAAIREFSIRRAGLITRSPSWRRRAFYLGSRLVSMLGFFAILVAPIAGVIIAEVVRWLIRKRRSRLLFQLVAIAVAAGALPLLLINLLMMVQGVAQGFSSQVGLLSVIWQGVYAAIAASSAY